MLREDIVRGATCARVKVGDREEKRLGKKVPMPSLRAMLVRTLVKYISAPIVQPGIPLETMRRRYEAAVGRARLPRGIQVEAITAGNVPGEWVSASATAPSRVMLYLHGGASYRTHAKSDIGIQLPWAVEQRQRYLGDRDVRTPLASPLHADLHGLPPLLIHVGSDEILLDDSTELAERARQAGVNVTLFIGEGMWHVWYVAAAIRPLFPEGRVALDGIGEFVQQQMPAHSSVS